jgi:cytochrome c biogenesis protein CcdA/thiol-disulfide isomerase/thioredoxin
MFAILTFAFISGIVTILSPCILPILPVVLSGTTGRGKARPYGILAGFVISFVVFTLSLSALVSAFGISPDALRIVAVVIIALFGLVMLVPRLAKGFEIMAARAARLGSRVGMPERKSGKAPGFFSNGFVGGLPVGLSLGLVWTPCVGPIMASVISLAITQQVDGGAVFITLAYTLGTSIPMLAVMLGGRALLNKVPVLSRNSAKVQRVFGVLMLAVAISIGFGWDRRFQAGILNVFPNYGAGLTAVEEVDFVREALDERAAASDGQNDGGAAVNARFSYDEVPKNGKLDDYGPAPDLVTTGEWFNIDSPDVPVSMDDLLGKVVIVDFWTYSCVNCVRTLPYLRAWYEQYRELGLVIIGVHTPEFEFEKNPDNVKKAIADLGVTWPVVLDNDFKQWRAYNNRYWPAHYFIDAEGRVRYFHFGEGEYRTSERVIQALLKEAGEKVSNRRISDRDLKLEGRTPETYLGYARAKNFVSAVGPTIGSAVEYKPSRALDNGEWNLEGKWTINREYVVPSTSGVLQIGFNAKDVYLVIDPDEGEGSVEVLVDGEVTDDTPDVAGGLLNPSESRLYHLVGLEKAGEHILKLNVHGKLKLYAFTFG